MSQLYTALVNETVVEAVRVALDNFSAEHHTTAEATALPGVITQAEEAVIHRAILSGLQNLQSVQNTVSAAKDDHEHAHAGIPAARRSDEAAGPSVKDAMSRLAANATSLQAVVREVATRIRTHLGDSAQPGVRDAGAIAAVYNAAPEVTRVLEAAVQQQQQSELQEAAEARAAAGNYSIAAHLSSFSAAQWVWLSATLVVGYLMVRLVFGRLLGFSGVRNRRRVHTVLIGLPDSGKTALFAQLVRHVQLRETRTSMRENVGPLLAARQRGLSASAAGVTVVDCPGHPRLREHMLRAVGEAVNVVVVVDAVTVQDSQHEGVAALAELLLTVMQAPEFYGVKKVLFACTKRDEVTSYAAKAVRKLLEAAMVASIESRQNAMGRVESVRDSKNAVIAVKGRKSGGGGGGGRRYVLSVDGGEGEGYSGVGGAPGGARKFSFDQLGIPMAFVDVSSRPHPTEHKYSVMPIEEFLLHE